ncbi:MAG: response regulator [Desulfobacteraceae bacterium]|nr:response regulator [Desulfobacteraceae bacterium]MBU4054930.1 response regulator [Pseudomonadota bacterium]
MKILIAEDDFTSRLVLQGILNKFGDVHVAVQGKECVEAFKLSLETGNAYDLICLDIMMPEMDGHQALKEIRRLEAFLGIKNGKEVKVLMTTVLDDPKNVFEAYYRGGATSYLVKPVHSTDVIKELQQFGLIKSTNGGQL